MQSIKLYTCRLIRGWAHRTAACFGKGSRARRDAPACDPPIAGTLLVSAWHSSDLCQVSHFFLDKVWAWLNVAADGGPLPRSSRGQGFSSGGWWKWSHVVLSQARQCQLPSGQRELPRVYYCMSSFYTQVLRLPEQHVMKSISPDYCWHSLSWYSWFSVLENCHIRHYKKLQLPEISVPLH